RDTKRHRALKLMLPQLLLDDDMRARFTREGIMTAGIESEHLVEVFDVGVDAQTRAPFLVMELLRGEDLGARLKRGERTRPAEGPTCTRSGTSPTRCSSAPRISSPRRKPRTTCSVCCSR